MGCRGGDLCTWPRFDVPTWSTKSCFTQAAVSASDRASVTFLKRRCGLKEIISSKRSSEFICHDVVPRAPRNIMARDVATEKGLKTRLSASRSSRRWWYSRKARSLLISTKSLSERLISATVADRPWLFSGMAGSSGEDP